MKTYSGRTIANGFKAQKAKKQSGSGKKKGKKRRWAAVICPIHGREAFPKGLHAEHNRQVKTPVPKSKAESVSGCPKCAKVNHEHH